MVIDYDNGDRELSMLSSHSSIWSSSTTTVKFNGTFGNMRVVVVCKKTGVVRCDKSSVIDLSNDTDSAHNIDIQNNNACSHHQLAISISSSSDQSFEASEAAIVSPDFLGYDDCNGEDTSDLQDCSWYKSKFPPGTMTRRTTEADAFEALTQRAGNKIGRASITTTGW